MKLILLYGPPAVGKLTVAKELATLTGYKLFHNHLTVDAVVSLFKFDSPGFWDHVRHLREYLLEEAARSNVSLIFTFVYAAGDDEKTLDDYMRIIEKHGGEVYLVQLKTSPDELKKRVGSANRRKYKKMTSEDDLQAWLTKYDLFSSIPHRESLTIDNTNCSPKQVAQQIVKHFKLT